MALACRFWWDAIALLIQAALFSNFYSRLQYEADIQDILS